MSRLTDTIDRLNRILNAIVSAVLRGGWVKVR